MKILLLSISNFRRAPPSLLSIQKPHPAYDQIHNVSKPKAAIDPNGGSISPGHRGLHADAGSSQPYMVKWNKLGAMESVDPSDSYREHGHLSPELLSCQRKAYISSTQYPSGQCLQLRVIEEEPRQEFRILVSAVPDSDHAGTPGCNVSTPFWHIKAECGAGPWPGPEINPRVAE
ncbi:uncharacterized protein CLUP02_15100 [Colletotrichum lupini]|uniref:Uncharacterized protein n=1 Tax=Colletotrichum lupini TaxID=145971 RepID=A0A9Q8T5F1_9PEZI|nr:uncharacterized protein CLUP02_15100 [Colletotrichum lupini]UQC89569.1 hypothetical protein CLUP02_15100 [Colletotrichum lupini]